MHGKTQIFLIKQDLKFYQKLKKPFWCETVYKFRISASLPYLDKLFFSYFIFFFLRAEIRKFSEIRYVNKFWSFADFSAVVFFVFFFFGGEEKK